MNDKQEPAGDSSLLKLPRSSYPELAKIIMAYGRVDKPASLEDISHRCGINETVVSANNAFLKAIGLIEGGKAKIATEPGLTLSRALDHNLAEDIASAWKMIVQQSPFFDKIISAVRIRRFFEATAFESHIAYSSGEPKSPQIMTGARTIVEILKAAGIISEADGKIVLSTGGGLTIKESYLESLPNAPSPSPTPSQTLYSGQYGTILMQINLNISADATSLEGIGEKIRKVIREIEGFSDTENAQQGQ
jgi:hypothetical protein